MAALIERDLGVDVANMPGAGAAGGLGAGCMAFLRGSLNPGVEMLLDVAGFDAALQTAETVVLCHRGVDNE